MKIAKIKAELIPRDEATWIYHGLEFYQRYYGENPYNSLTQQHKFCFGSYLRQLEDYIPN